jgi:hypothetical protein
MKMSNEIASAHDAAIAALTAELQQCREALAGLLHEDGGSLAHAASHPKCVAARAALKERT